MLQRKVCVFVDGENLFFSSQKLDLKIDYLKLRDRLVGKRELMRAYYYDSDREGGYQKRFFDMLKFSGYQVKTVPLKDHGEDEYHGSLDVMLAVDMLTYAHRDMYDIAVLVSGKRHFLYVVETVKELGKKVEVACFDHCVSKKLRLVADHYISLNEIIDKIRLHEERGKEDASDWGIDKVAEQVSETQITE